MRHSKRRYQLNRFTSWHEATVKSLARSVLIYQSVKTTKARAKATRSLVEKLIGLGRKNTLAAKRAAYRILGDHNLVKVLFTDIAPRFVNRTSGFSRIIPFGLRRGDDAKLVIFELTEKKIKKISKKPKKEKTGAPLPKEDALPPQEVQEKPKTATAVDEKHKHDQEAKPAKGFLKGIRGIFKKERDSL